MLGYSMHAPATHRRQTIMADEVESLGWPAGCRPGADSPTPLGEVVVIRSLLGSGRRLKLVLRAHRQPAPKAEWGRPTFSAMSDTESGSQQTGP